MKRGGSLRSTGPCDLFLSERVIDKSIGMCWQFYDELFSINVRGEAVGRVRCAWSEKAVRQRKVQVRSRLELNGTSF